MDWSAVPIIARYWWNAARSSGEPVGRELAVERPLDSVVHGDGRLWG
jgi:hypothetical protein